MPIVVVLFILIDCQEHSTGLDENNNSHLLNYMDYGCQGSGDMLAKTNSQLLEDWYYDGGVLDLNFRFTTVCDAIFSDSCAVDGNHVELFLSNDQEAIAKCVCEYLNTFSVAWPVPGNVHITLNYRYKVHPEYNTMIDTVITVK